MTALPSAAPQRSPLLEATLSLMREPERALLMRLAPLVSFDRTIFGRVSRDIGSAEVVPLADLAEYRFVLEVRDRPGRYRIRDDMRRVLLDSWGEGQPSGTVPDDLSAFCERLAGQLSRIPGTDPAEVLSLRLFTAPPQALEEWKDLYAEADQRFDLVRCRSLIKMLSWVAAVSPDVDAVREDYETYLEARGLWTDEWYRTGPFVLPVSSDQVFESLLRGDQGRVLELQGFGGYGKTMHIRRLIARRCVPARIPCARIDFDAVDPFAAIREPYLILLEMAEQLDRQLPGDAFGKLVRTYSADRAVLYRRRPAAATRPREIKDSAALAQAKARSDADAEVQRRFYSRLAEIPADKPVMLVLDTLEVLLHLPDTSRGPAAKLLFMALATAVRAPSVRLVLAGRYEIPGELRKLVPDWCEPFTLPRFSDDEARTYLVEKRQVKQEHVAAAIQAGGGVPFSLALLADLIEEDPAISPDKIAKYRGAEYAYLIERVVKRIGEQPVRWVLRYAAIPRSFDYEFVRDVIWPRVREEMAGTGGHDRPAGDDIPQEDTGDTWVVSQAPPADEQTVQQVWNQVRRYASGSSWLNPDKDDPYALRLQTEVVRPLRELLGKNPIFSILHADAAEYFLRRAAEEGARTADGTAGASQRDRTAEFLREAVYHRFQSEGEAASRWWEDQIRIAAGPVARRALADELARRPEYTDLEGPPAPPGGDVTFVPSLTLQQARLEFCIASAELATLQAPLRPRHPLWQDASETLECLADVPPGALSPGRLALARTAVALGTRQQVDTDADMRAALDSPDPSPRERLWITVLYAYRLVAEGSGGAGEALERARQLERDAMEERDLRQMLASGLVQHLRERGNLGEAIKACTTAVAEGLGGDADFQLAEARMRLASGDAEGARSVAESIVDEGSSRSPQAQVVLARCWRHQQRFGVALASARSTLAALEETNEASSAAAGARGDALLESGEIAAMLLRVGDARDAYADAIRLFGEAQDPEAIAHCHLREAVLLMTGLGHLRAAGVALDNADRAAPEGGDIALLAQLSRCELASRLGDHAQAAAIVGRLEWADRRGALPSRMAATAVAGLAFGPRRDRDHYTARLTEALGQVTPAAARLQLLSRADRCPVLKAQAKAVKQLREAVIPPGGWDTELNGFAARDRAVLRIRAAAFARLIDDHDDAAALLRAALEEIRGEEEPLAGLIGMLRLARQLRATDIVTEAGRAAMTSADSQAEQCPLLAAAAVIEYLQAAAETGATPVEDPAAACERAAVWLDRGGLSAEALWARLAELYAATNPGDMATTASYLETAVRLYEAAGDVQRAEKVAVPGTRLAYARPEVTVDLTLSRDAIRSKVAGWRIRFLPRRRGAASALLRQAITSWAEAPGSDPYPPDLPDMMAGRWLELRAALADLLDAAELTKRLQRHAEQPDLSVRIYDGALQPLPWELAVTRSKPDAPLFAEFRRAYREPVHAVPDTRLIRVVQAGLKMFDSSLQVDGVSGPDTARALSAHSPDPGALHIRADDPVTVQWLHKARLQGAPPRVIVVRPVPAEGRRPSLAAERRYASAGFDVSTVDQTQISALTRMLRTEPPPVIVHIVGGLVARVGVTAIDLHGDSGGWGTFEATGLLTAADLDHAFRAVPRDWPAPVVVLDVPAPTGHREVADQMLLRNCLAAELFAMGGARAVVATGLADRKAADLVQDELVEGFAHGNAVGNVVQRMRQQAPASGFNRFVSSAAFAGTALWSNDPSMRLPALGGT